MDYHSAMTGMPPATTPPLTPPTEPDPNAVAKRNIVWPTVIGIVAIVLAGMGMLAYSIGLIVWAIMGSYHWSPEPQVEVNNAFTLTLSAIHILLAIVLLFCGIALLRRRRAGVRWLMIWSWLRIVHGLLQGVAQGWMQLQMFEQMNDASTVTFAPAMAVGTAIFTALWASALPVFFLIWFTRKRIRRDVDEYFQPAPEAHAH